MRASSSSSLLRKSEKHLIRKRRRDRYQLTCRQISWSCIGTIGDNRPHSHSRSLTLSCSSSSFSMMKEKNIITETRNETFSAACLPACLTDCQSSSFILYYIPRRLIMIAIAISQAEGRRERAELSWTQKILFLALFFFLPFQHHHHFISIAATNERERGVVTNE